MHNTQPLPATCACQRPDGVPTSTAQYPNPLLTVHILAHRGHKRAGRTRPFHRLLFQVCAADIAATRRASARRRPVAAVHVVMRPHAATPPSASPSACPRACSALYLSVIPCDALHRFAHGNQLPLCYRHVHRRALTRRQASPRMFVVRSLVVAWRSSSQHSPLQHSTINCNIVLLIAT